MRVEEESKTMSKSIWILNHYAVTPDMPGGTRHFDFAKELNKRGYDVTIFTSSFHYQKLKELKLSHDQLYRIERVDGIRFIWVKTFPYAGNNWRRFVNMLSYMYRVYNVAKLLAGRGDLDKPDVIIGSTVHLFAVFAAYRLSRYFQSRFIMEVRDIWPQTLIDLGKMSRFHPAVLVFWMLERFLYKQAEKIISLLPRGEDYFCSLGIDKDKVIYIPNGINIENFRVQTKNNHDEYFRIFYVGGHSHTDNLYVFLSAAEKVRAMDLQIMFILVGDGIEKKSLVEYTQQRKLTDIVSFREPVVKSDIPKVLAEADALYLSMQNSDIYKYGISFNKLFDYLASGKPIILYGNPASNPIVEANAGIVADTLGNLAEAIVTICNMPPEDRLEMGMRGRDYAEKYHDIPVLVDKLENIFAEGSPSCWCN